MKRIGVDLSPKQHSRIRNGHYVRVKKGSGVLLVNPGNYDALSKTFLRGKSKDISLTAEEIMANRQISPEAHNERRGSGMDPPSKNVRAPMIGGYTTKPVPVQRFPVDSSGAGFQNNIGGTKVRTMTGLTSGYLYDAGQGNLDANIGNMALNIRSVKSRQGNGITGGMVDSPTHTQVPTVMGRGAMLIGRPQALQSQPLSANYQFKNTFPPAFKKHME